jgi:CMP-N,N'-diacetyllegionaminic acid synthase
MIENKSEVWALIPARSGSKGVKDKNIRKLAGYPLIAYSIVAAKQCTSVSRIILTTDSEQYAEIGVQYGAEVPFLRPSNISGDEATDLQFFKHTVDWFRKNEGDVADYFVHLRPTTPFRTPKVMDEAISGFINSSFSALRSVHKMTDTSYKTFEIEDEKLKLLCGGGYNIESTTFPRQSFPATYDPNGYIDIVRTSMIDEGNIHADNVKAFITDISYEIDEIDDFEFLQFVVNKKPNIVKKLFQEYL